jgi:hypothetical protein
VARITKQERQGIPPIFATNSDFLQPTDQVAVPFVACNIKLPTL